MYLINVPHPKQNIVKSCGHCPHAMPSRLSKVFYTCGLHGGLVKSEDPVCLSAYANLGKHLLGDR